MNALKLAFAVPFVPKLIHQIVQLKREDVFILFLAVFSIDVARACFDAFHWDMWNSNFIFSAVKKGMAAELVDIGLTTLLFSLWTRLFRMGLDFSQVLRGVLCRDLFLGFVTHAILIMNQVATEGWVRQELPIHVALMQLAGGQPFEWTRGYLQVHLALVFFCTVSLIFQLAQLARRPLWYAALVVLLFGFLWTLPGGLSRAGVW